MRKRNVEIAFAQPGRGAAEKGLAFLREQFGGRKQHFPAPFDKHAVALPLAHEAAGGEMCHARLIGQLFVVHVELYAFRDPVPDAGCEVDQHGGKALAGSMTGQREMQSTIQTR